MAHAPHVTMRATKARIQIYTFDKAILNGVHVYIFDNEFIKYEVLSNKLIFIYFQMYGHHWSVNTLTLLNV